MACTCANNLFSPFISYDPPPSSLFLLLLLLVPPLFTHSLRRPFVLSLSLSLPLSIGYTPSSRSLPLSPLSIYVAFRIIAFFVERVWLNSLEIIHLPNCHSSTWIVDASPRKPSPPSTPLPPSPPLFFDADSYPIATTTTSSSFQFLRATEPSRVKKAIRLNRLAPYRRSSNPGRILLEPDPLELPFTNFRITNPSSILPTRKYKEN